MARKLIFTGLHLKINDGEPVVIHKNKEQGSHYTIGFTQKQPDEFISQVKTARTQKRSLRSILSQRHESFIVVPQHERKNLNKPSYRPPRRNKLIIRSRDSYSFSWKPIVQKFLEELIPKNE